MAPVLMPLALTVAGAATSGIIGGLMNKPPKTPKMPVIPSPSTVNPDTTPGSNPAALLGGDATSNKTLSNAQTINNKLLGG